MRRWLAIALLLVGLAASAQERTDAPPLRVCADPDNLPFSHQDGSGFENRIAELLARELGRPLQYAWLPDRRGFVRKTLGERLCDVIVGVPARFERTLNTRPYYRSSYVLVDRAQPASPPVNWSDPRLRTLRLGVQLVGDDMAATPPGHALVMANLEHQVRGFPLAGETPSAQRAVQAIERGELDAAYLWGPQAGFFARRATVPMRVSRLAAPAGLSLPFEFAIAMGVRRGDEPLRDALDAVIARRLPEIRSILADHGVPLLPEPAR